MTMLLTGLTRDGVFLVENGEITGAVNNFRFNMSPLDVLKQASTSAGPNRRLSREWSDWFTRSRDAADGGRGLQHVLGVPSSVAIRIGIDDGCRPQDGDNHDLHAAPGRRR